MNVSDRLRFSQYHSGNVGEPDSFRSESVEDNLALLGHEIRNPLSALTYALQAWPSAKDDRQLEQKLLQIMRRQVTQLTRLCNDLLDIGKSQNGKMSIYRTAMDLRKAIQNATEELRPFAESRGNALSVELEDGPFTVLGDESRLTQVFANLMHNSAKFTDRGGHIHVSVTREDDSVLVRLCDNGRGMCREKIKGLFRMDNRTKNCGDLMGEGLGIGLRLAKNIVELHNGSIEAASKGLGHGSTFLVRLPLAPSNASSEADASCASSRQYADCMVV